MVVDLPPGGHMSINDDGSVGVYDANGDLQGTVAAAWAYDVNGDPVPTYYEIRDGKLYQVVIPTPGVISPVTADGPYGGSDPVTGRDVTATPLQGGGEVVNQSGGPVMVNVPTDSPYNDVGGIDPLGNLDMDPPTQPAPTTPLPFGIGSPADSGTDTGQAPGHPHHTPPAVRYRIADRLGHRYTRGYSERASVEPTRQPRHGNADAARSSNGITIRDL